MVVRGLGRHGMEFGISGCKLLYTEWINKALPYSAGSYIQCPVRNHSGDECVCVYL